LALLANGFAFRLEAGFAADEFRRGGGGLGFEAGELSLSGLGGRRKAFGEADRLELTDCSPGQ
jgi:hypothetical protein